MKKLISVVVLMVSVLGCSFIVSEFKGSASASEIVVIETQTVDAIAETKNKNKYTETYSQPAAVAEEGTYICTEYQQYIYEISAEYNVCPELIMAIIERESSGRADAVNGDCKGLMQVSERWHKDRMERLGVTDLYDPYDNIVVGTDYLMELATRYKDVGIVLMKYNGDSRVNAFIRGECELSDYAVGILERSAQLKALHLTMERR